MLHYPNRQRRRYLGSTSSPISPDRQCLNVPLQGESPSSRKIIADEQVNIPKLAAEQARTYTETYKMPVDLVAAFPSFNIDDPDQLAPSLGPAGWQLSEKKTDLRMKDWFPEPILSDAITLLVRRADGPSCEFLSSLRLNHTDE